MCLNIIIESDIVVLEKTLIRQQLGSHNVNNIKRYGRRPCQSPAGMKVTKEITSFN